MLQAFIIVSREGLESFLIAAIILAYVRKIGFSNLAPAVYSGIVVAILLSLGLVPILMKVANQALWEGILGVVAVVMVGSLVIHMWRVGPHFKKDLEKKLSTISSRTTRAAAVGVFLFTVLMITREGSETALMLFQVKNQPFILGGLLGLIMAGFIAWLWAKFSHLVNLKRFFMVTGIFLLIFMVQTGVYAFHELCEAGLFAQSDAWHALTEPYSPDGMYGKWVSFVTVPLFGIWLTSAGIIDWLKRKKTPAIS